MHGCLAHREVILPHAHPTCTNARMDLVVHIPGRGSPVNIDISIASALSVEALRGRSAFADGRAAEIAAGRKRDDYPLIRVWPFIIEDHGRWGEDASSLARQIAPSEASARSRALRELYQRLATVLQRHAADAVLAAVNHGR